MANRVSYWWESELKQIEIDLRQSIGDAEYERAHALGTTLSGADAIGMAMEVLSR